MNIFKTPDNTWRVRIRKRGHPTQTANFPTEAEARAWGAEIEARYKTGNRADRRITEKTTLRELLQRYLDEYVPNYSDSEREARRVERLKERKIASLFVAAVRPVDVADFVKERVAEFRTEFACGSVTPQHGPHSGTAKIFGDPCAANYEIFGECPCRSGAGDRNDGYAAGEKTSRFYTEFGSCSPQKLPASGKILASFTWAFPFSLAQFSMDAGTFAASLVSGADGTSLQDCMGAGMGRTKQ